MNFVFANNLKIAYEMSDKILEELKYDPEKMINTSTVLEYIQENFCPNITVIPRSFKSLDIKKEYGAMMLIEFADEKSKELCKPFKATIVLNDDNDAVFQRFSLFHELGHLVTLNRENLFDTDDFVISTHINYEVTNISEEEYSSSSYMLKEQIANIFALRVLMPSQQFFDKMRELKNIAKVAEFFGLKEEAVISRMKIGV